MVEITSSDIYKLKKRDKKTFEKVFFLFSNKLAAFVNCYIKDKSVTWDIVQNTFIKVIRDINKYDRLKSTFKTWLFTIGKNEALSYLKSNEKKHISYNDDISYFKEERGSEFKIEELKGKLNPNEYIIIILRFCNNFTIKEIATFFNYSIKKTRIEYSKVMKKTKRILEEMLEL